MGKHSKNPRYHVFSCRASKAEAEKILAVVPEGQRGAFFLEAILEKIRRQSRRGRGQGRRQFLVADEAEPSWKRGGWLPR